MYVNTACRDETLIDKKKLMSLLNDNNFLKKILTFHILYCH